jgi:hypothetical protein
MGKRFNIGLGLFIILTCVSGLAIAGPQNLVFVNDGKSAAPAPKNPEPIIPGELSQTVKLTPGQRKLLSPQADFLIYGPASPISREQILKLRESKAKQLVGAIMGTKQKAVNARAYWNENLYTTFTTQSEVSSAVYGPHIVAGWNDLESYAASNSIANWAVSHDGGKTFTDSLNGLPVYTAPGIVATGGDPSIDVGTDGTFYYSTICTYNDGANDLSAICLYESLDSGDTFNLSSYVYTGDTADFLDKPLLGVDRTNGKVYITYAYFDDVSPLYTIYAWNVTDESIIGVAQNDEGLQGPIPAAEGDGALYVAYEAWDADNNSYIKIGKSTDYGATFGSEVNVYGPFVGAADPDASVFCGRPAVKGNIRSNEFPSLAIDPRASGAGHGNLYIAFNGRGSLTAPVDVYLTRSTDGGTTWSTPIVANPRAAADDSDKFFPWISVNGTGKVGLIYYERKKSPNVTGLSNNNWWISANVRRFSPSLSFIDSAKISPEFPVIVNNDYTAACYMAEYNSISTNRKGIGDNNFVALWGDNRFGDPDIQFGKIVPY